VLCIILYIIPNDDVYTSRFVLMSTPGRVRRDAYYNIKYNVSVYYYICTLRVYTSKPEKFLHIRVSSQFTRHCRRCRRRRMYIHNTMTKAIRRLSRTVMGGSLGTKEKN